MIIDELAKQMKEKGITSKAIAEDNAKEILRNRNYYMKSAAYRINCSKCSSEYQKGKVQK